MNPFFFGDSQAPLLGVHHPPRERGRHARGAVLCYPMGQEYMRAHRAFRQLSMLLSRVGIHVLRFDYFATGDSAGEGEEAALEIWTDNVVTAIDELRDTAGISTVSLVGLRLGAALATMAAERSQTDVDALVLWDPVLDGAAYLAELAPPDLPRAPSPLRFGAGGDVGDVVGVMGFPIPLRLAQELERLHPAALPIPSVRRSMIVSSEDRATDRDLHDRFAARGVASIHCPLPSDGRWGEVDNFGSALIPQAIIQRIVEFLSLEVAP